MHRCDRYLKNNAYSISVSAISSTRFILICCAISRKVITTTCGVSTLPTVRLKHGWMYLVAVIDWYSRFIVSWQLSDTLEMPFVLTVVRSALQQAKPEIWNSDQGSHFTSDKYIDLLKDAQIQISMDGKNRALDNIITERFWRTLKYEHVYLHEYNSPWEARQQIGRFINEYNMTAHTNHLITEHRLRPIFQRVMLHYTILQLSEISVTKILLNSKNQCFDKGVHLSMSPAFMITLILQ